MYSDDDHREILGYVEAWVSSTLSGKKCTLEESGEVDCSLVEYGDLKYHIDREGKDTNQIRVSRYRLRKILKNYQELISIVFNKARTQEHEEAKAHFTALFYEFEASMTEMQYKQDFDDARIDAAQLVFDKFATHFVTFFKSTTVTNYIQMMGDGTLRFFLRKYRNLYRWSQQGAEAGVKLCRCYSLHRTNHQVGQQVSCFKKLMLRKAIRLVAQISTDDVTDKLNFLGEIYEEGKVLYQGHIKRPHGGYRTGSGRKKRVVDEPEPVSNPDASEEERDEFTDRLLDSGFFSGGAAASSKIGDDYAEL